MKCNRTMSLYGKAWRNSAGSSCLSFCPPESEVLFQDSLSKIHEHVNGLIAEDLSSHCVNQASLSKLHQSNAETLGQTGGREVAIVSQLQEIIQQLQGMKQELVTNRGCNKQTQIISPCSQETRLPSASISPCIDAALTSPSQVSLTSPRGQLQGALMSPRVGRVLGTPRVCLPTSSRGIAETLRVPVQRAVQVQQRHPVRSPSANLDTVAQHGGEAGLERQSSVPRSFGLSEQSQMRALSPLMQSKCQVRLSSPGRSVRLTCAKLDAASQRCSEVWERQSSVPRSFGLPGDSQMRVISPSMRLPQSNCQLRLSSPRRSPRELGTVAPALDTVVMRSNLIKSALLSKSCDQFSGNMAQFSCGQLAVLEEQRNSTTAPQRPQAVSSPRHSSPLSTSYGFRRFPVLRSVSSTTIL